MGRGPEPCTAVHSTRKPLPPTFTSDWNSRVTVLPELRRGAGGYQATERTHGVAVYVGPVKYLAWGGVPVHQV